MKFNSDIDIDLADRTQALAVLEHTPASILRDNRLTKHNSGIYVTSIPTDPYTGQASLDYQVAEERGYIKLDLLNVSLYTQIKNEQHLLELMNAEPAWDKLNDPEFFSKLIHVGNHYDLYKKCSEPINSIPRMAMFLALIRPGKRNLVGKNWKEISQTIWDKTDDGYAFKRSHGVAYAHLVVVHMNLLNQASELV